MEKFFFQIPENCNNKLFKEILEMINELIADAYNKGYEDEKGEMINE